MYAKIHGVLRKVRLPLKINSTLATWYTVLTFVYIILTSKTYIVEYFFKVCTLKV